MAIFIADIAEKNSGFSHKNGGNRRQKIGKQQILRKLFLLYPVL
jgi:hypothetical protein